MKSSLIVLALAAAAGADFIEMRGYTNSATCDDHAAYTSNSFIGCTAGTGSSYRMQCDSDEKGSYLIYLTEDCSGAPFSDTDAPFEFGCASSATNSSTSTYCKSGNYVPDDRAVNQYYYSSTECPAPEGGAFYAVNSFPTGDCNHADGGISYDYGCSDTAMIAQYYMDEDCQGDPFSASDILELGCANSAGPGSPIVDTVCNIEPNATKTVRPPAVPVPAEMLTKIQAAAKARVIAAQAARTKTVAATPF